MLFIKECKKTVCSLTYVLYAVVILIMYIVQFVPELQAPLARPQDTGSNANADYGSIMKEEPEILMPAATKGLICEYLEGGYVTYPFGFYKNIRLKEEDSAKIAAVIEELTDLTKAQLDSFTAYEPQHYEDSLDENGEHVMVYKDAVLPIYNMSTDISYEHFRELMAYTDEIIGGASRYSKQYLLNNFAMIPMTYEEALAEYEEITDERNIAESYGRLYCDYMGIFLAIMPVFVCVGLWQMDKRSQMEQLIYSRKVSSVKLIMERYLALVSCMLLPIILTYLHAMIGVKRLYPEKAIHYAGIAVLTVIWLVPEIMIVTGMSIFVSELFSPLLAIFVQGAWWYTALQNNQNVGSITGYSLMIRHNTLGSADLFKMQYENFIQNRTRYLILSIITVLLTMVIYHRHRKGVGYEKRILRKNSVRKSEI